MSVWNRLLILPLIALSPALAAAADDAAELRNQDEKVIYAIGFSLSQHLSDFDLSERELQVLSRGLADGVLGRETPVAPQLWGKRIETLRKARAAQVARRRKAVADEYLARAAAEPQAQKRPSGLIYTELTAGSGSAPSPQDQVVVHYHGTRVDGSVFDSTREKSPARFALDRVIPCWTEGVQLMQTGGRARLVCPPELAYGDRGVPGSITPGAVLDFEVELLEVNPE